MSGDVSSHSNVTYLGYKPGGNYNLVGIMLSFEWLNQAPGVETFFHGGRIKKFGLILGNFFLIIIKKNNSGHHQLR